MPSNVFINYRRQLDAGVAGRIYDHLIHSLPGASIFMDVDKLSPGDDFEEALGRSLASCKVLLAIIGPEWTTTADAKGQSRLHHPDDFVRKEIRAALERGVRIIPVLVNSAKMPDKSVLPADLHDLAKRQAMEIRHERFSDDMAALATAVAATTPGARPAKWPRIAIAAGIVTILAGALVVSGYMFAPSVTSPGAPIKTAGCKPGFVWRDALFGDSVCVTRAERNEAIAQNANAENNREPGGGAYGQNTCRSGYVWREAVPNDAVCVTPYERDKARKQNAQDSANRL